MRKKDNKEMSGSYLKNIESAMKYDVISKVSEKDTNYDVFKDCYPVRRMSISKIKYVQEQD